jgi:membrane protein
VNTSANGVVPLGIPFSYHCIMRWFQHHFDLLKRTVKDFGKADPLIQGSSIAFFTIFALPGVMVILLRVATVLFDSDQVRDAMLEQASGLVGEEMGKYLKDVLDKAEIADTSVMDQIFGIAAILISGTMAFVALQRGLNKIWGVKIKKGQGLKKQLVTRGIGLLVMAGMSILLPVTLLFDNLIVFVLDNLHGGALPAAALNIIGQVTSFLLMFIVMVVLFKVIPSAKIHWADVWPGALLAAVLFVMGRYLIRGYIELTDIGEAFGAGQAVLVVLVWVFMAAMIILFGAFHCHTVAEARGHGIEPGRQASSVDGVGKRS